MQIVIMNISLNKKCNLKEKIDTIYSSNLSVVKIIACVAVIYSHSFTVTTENSLGDGLSQLTHGQLSFGGLSVAVFLFSSGLLSTKSILKQTRFIPYLIGRLVRILPALIMVVLLTTFILGPIVTEVSVFTYFTSVETYSYLLYIVLLPVYSLTGVFIENPVSLVNGSLWTLILEMLCYIGLYITLKMQFITDKKKCALIIISILCVIIGFDFLPFLNNFVAYLRPLLMFFIGMIYYAYADKIILSTKLFICSLVVFFIGLFTGYSTVAILVLLPYIVICIAYLFKQNNFEFAKLGKFTYGIYLLAFPIQQTFEVYFNALTPLSNTVLSFITSLILAYFLYYLVEKPSMRIYKTKKEKYKI